MDDILDHNDEDKEKEFDFFLKIPLTITGPLFLVGIILKILALPFSSSLITLSVILFLFSSIISFIYQKLKGKKMTLFDFMTLIGANFFACGLLFKMQHWPYGGLLLTTSSMFLLIGIFFLALRKN